MGGVCDTPLHLFVRFMDNTMVEQHPSSPPWRAYAIRPYTCSYDSWIIRWLQHPFSPPWRAYAIRPYGFTINRIDLTNCMDAREYAFKGAKMKTTPTYWCIHLYSLYLACKKFYHEARKIMLKSGDWEF